MKKCILLIAFVIFNLNLLAQIRYVRAGATGSNNGTSWTNAFTSLQPAIDAVEALGGGQVWVASGTYKPTATTDRNVSFVLKNNVAIYGGFNGSETQLTQRNFKSNVTILSGEIGTSAITDNSYHVITANSTVTGTGILDGVQITRGYDDSSTSPASVGGGGFFGTSGADPQFRNCVFLGNQVGFVRSGGAVFIVNSTSRFINCTFSNNVASNGYGGAVFAQSFGNPFFINCLFFGNDAGSGGGIVSRTGLVTIINSTFSKNRSLGTLFDDHGGGALTAFQTGGDFLIHNSIIWGNTSAVTGRGEIYATGGSFSTSSSNNIIPAAFALGTNAINTDPGFFNATANDFRIRLSCSVAFNAGLSSNVPTDVTTDVENKLRNAYGGVDIGAYEFQDFTVDKSGAVSVDCFGQNLSINFTATSGAPFTNYQVGTITTTSNQIDAPIGTYQIKVLQPGCSNAFKIADIVISQPTALNVPLATPVSPTCNGLANGTLTLNASGGTPPYQFLLQKTPDFTYDVTNSTGLFTGIPAGDYAYSVFDSKFCNLGRVLVVSEPPLLTNTPSITNISCFGTTDGQISLTASGGTTPYSYSLNGTSYVSTNIFNGLSANTYNTRIRDSKNCLSATQVAQVTQPSLLTMAASIVNGFEIEAVASGGTSPYQYSIDGVSFQAGTIFTNIVNGQYTVTAKDVRNCLATAQAAIIITAIDEELNNLSVYPNPTMESVEIEGMTGDEYLQFTDQAGRQYLGMKAKKGNNSIDLKSLPSGMYVLSITASSYRKAKTIKLIKR
jgi:SprB repeat/Secretion system C-terminal sorting domain